MRFLCARMGRKGRGTMKRKQQTGPVQAVLRGALIGLAAVALLAAALGYLILAGVIPEEWTGSAGLAAAGLGSVLGAGVAVGAGKERRLLLAACTGAAVLLLLLLLHGLAFRSDAYRLGPVCAAALGGALAAGLLGTLPKKRRRY